MVRAIPLSWHHFIREHYTDSPILLGYSHRSLTGQFGGSGSTLHVMYTILGEESFQTCETKPTAWVGYC